MVPSLQTLAGNQVSVKTLANAKVMLPSHLIHTRAATVIQTTYREMVATRKQRLLAEVEKAGLLEKCHHPWELTNNIYAGIASGWIELQKWTYVDYDFNKDFIFCSVQYQYKKESKCLVFTS